MIRRLPSLGNIYERKMKAGRFGVLLFFCEKIRQFASQIVTYHKIEYSQEGNQHEDV